MPINVVLQVWFDKYLPDKPDSGGNDFLGVPFWKPKGSPVFRWAIDYVSCDDTRWVVFGPLKREDVADVVATLGNGVIGYRIINEHCWEYREPRFAVNEFPCDMWTDG